MSDDSAFEKLTIRPESGPVVEHTLSNGHRCVTESAMLATPGIDSIDEIVVGLGDHIPLWREGAKLNWRFRNASFVSYFPDPDSKMQDLQTLFEDALAQWGEASPITFQCEEQSWDFEIVMQQADSCNDNGCVLASAFFPDPGRNALSIYPRMLKQSPAEQLETMVHEIGHVFGLRHFFAPTHEFFLASEIYGEHEPFSIMNYGAKSVLTEADKKDLKDLYAEAWMNPNFEINGLHVKLMTPFHSL